MDSKKRSNERSLWTHWNSKTPREVAREAAAKGEPTLSLALKHLEQRLDLDFTTTSKWFHSEVCAWVLQLLGGRQYFKASHVLTKVKMDPNVHMLNIARETSDGELRNYILEQLDKTVNNDFKSTPEWTNFMNHLYLLQSVQKSFESSGVTKQNKVFGTDNNIIVINSSEVRKLSIEKLIAHSEEWKSKIASHLFLSDLDERLVIFLNYNTLWNTLIEYSDTALLKQWINISFSEKCDCDSDISELSKHYSKDTISKLNTIFEKLKIYDEMILEVYRSNCFDYTKNSILNTLCNYGYFMEHEKINLKLYLNRLIESENIIKLNNLSLNNEIISENEILNDLLINYCTQNGLCHVLIKCVDYKSYFAHSQKENANKSDYSTLNIFDLWVLIQKMSTEKNSDIFTAIYETCKYLTEDLNINNYLKKNPLILLALILTDGNVSIFDIFSCKKLNFKNNIEILTEECLKTSLPHLCSIDNRIIYKSNILNNDVNIYQLLSDYKGLDISKLFEFQLVKQHLFRKRKLSSTSNTNSDKSDSDTNKNLQYNEEIFNFSHAILSKKYGFKRHLSYQYYLKQNRACMATQALLWKEYQTYGKRSIKTMKEACGYAHGLAMDNWHNPIITATCIAFISMMGYNASKCRTNIACANTLYVHFLKSGKTSDECITEVDTLLAQSTSNNLKGSQDILSLLENIAISHYKQCKKDGTFNIGYLLNHWQTVIRYANIHNLPLSTSIFKIFTCDNLWLEFLIFGDVFKYPPKTLLDYCKDFSNPTVIEHLNHIITCAGSESFDYCSIKSSSEDQSLSNDISKENRSNINNIGRVDVSFMEDLWEVMSYCHGPEDPPGALIKASAKLSCPLLALVATCYEPEAFDICWAQWVLSNIDDCRTLSFWAEWKNNEMEITDTEIKSIMTLAIQTGHCATLLESFQIFYQENPLLHIITFIKSCLVDHSFDEDTIVFLKKFQAAVAQHTSQTFRQAFLPRMQRHEYISIISTQLLLTALSVMESSSEQKLFLECICITKYSKKIPVHNLSFQQIHAVLNISIQCEKYLDLKEMFGDSHIEYHKKYIGELIESKHFEEALSYARIVKNPIDNILISSYLHKFEIFKEEPTLHETELSSLKFWTKCSEDLKKADIHDPTIIINFLKNQLSKLINDSQRFYLLRIICGWFELTFNTTYNELAALKDEIINEMWKIYFSMHDINDVYFMSIEDTIHFVLNYDLEKNTNHNNKFYGADFNKLLVEIEEESHISIVNDILDEKESEKLQITLRKLIDRGLIIDAFKLNKMFPSLDCSESEITPLNLIIISLKIAEEIINPQDLTVISKMGTYLQPIKYRSTLEEMEYLGDEFEELVLINDKNEDVNEGNSHLAGRREAECLQILDMIASKNNLKIVKKISDIYRISLQIGWTYQKVLKYENSPLDFIKYLSGVGRMPLLKIILRTYDISSEKIVDFLSFDIVTALISPHLTKAPGFKQKEFFHYTLWGYRLDTNFDMFLNLCPDDNSLLGGIIMQYLAAFRKYFKGKMSKNAMENSELEEEDNDNPLVEEGLQNENDVENTNENKKNCFDTQSIISNVTNSSSPFKRMSKDRKHQLDVISCKSIHIKTEINSCLKTFLKGKKISNKQINIVSIELLILAHECFSSVCDTEGIATILRSAQTLTTHLLAARSWRLIVHLLTGIARYTEMAYVFQILRDNDQFEYLLGQLDYVLGQHNNKIINFKHGLLEFLKKHCPGDTELYHLVAIHFSMYSEAADVKKKQANDLIVTLIQIALDSMKALKKRSEPEWIILTNTDNNKLLLDTAINHCTDAAELYVKSNSLNAAREMAGLAQLLALQNALLLKAPTKCILKLLPSKMDELMSTHLTFMESLVFATANDCCGGGWMDRWREIIYQRVIKGCDPVFVRDIITNRPEMALYIINRYDQENNRIASAEMAINELRLYFEFHYQ